METVLNPTPQEASETLPPEALDKSLIDYLNEHPDEASQITSIDLNSVISLCAEIDGSSTTKRLFSIPKIEEKFAKAFVGIETYKDYTKVYENLLRIFREMKSDVEYDYFSANIKLSGEVAND